MGSSNHLLWTVLVLFSTLNEVEATHFRGAVITWKPGTELVS